MKKLVVTSEEFSALMEKNKACMTALPNGGIEYQSEDKTCSLYYHVEKNTGLVGSTTEPINHHVN